MTSPSPPSRQISISVFGLGYVGSVSAACLANLGHRVIGVDSNPLKVEAINDGRSPVVEAGMAELVAAERRNCNLHATSKPADAVAQSEVSLIAVGTPCLRNGNPDLSAIGRVSEEIGRAIALKKEFHWIAVRSTVLPGTLDTLVIPTIERVSGRRAREGFAVCSNPEFLREGTAIADFFHPPLTLLGAQDPAHLAPFRELYGAIPGRVVETSLRTAEMAKYVSNAFHALKVDFANEIGTLCQLLGVNAEEVTEIFCADTKLNISPAYLKPGFAFGGSCLPKDVRALAYRAKQLDLRVPLLEAILPSNQAHAERAVELVLESGKRKIGILGLSFKAGTDDLRESPLLYVVKRLIAEGRQILIYDRNVSWSCIHGANREFAESEIPHIASLLRPSIDEVVSHAELLVIGNSDEELKRLNDLLRSDQAVLDFAHLQHKIKNSRGLCW